MKTQTSPGVNCDLRDLQLEVSVDLIEIERWIADAERQSGQKAGGYLLGIPVAEVETKHLDAEIAHHDFDLGMALHTEAQMYTKPHPGMQKWHLESLGQYGLFIQTPAQLNASQRTNPFNMFQKDLFRELTRANLVREFGGWCFPYTGALEKLALGKNAEVDFTEARKVQMTLLRGSKEIGKYESDLREAAIS